MKLDRAVTTRSFVDMFTDVKLLNLEILTSNHSPVFLEPTKSIKAAGAKAFRFENAWLREPMCQQIVEETWYRYQNCTLQDKLKECAILLTEWGNEITGSFRNRINQCKNIMKINKGRRDRHSVNIFQQASQRLNEVYVQMEVFWKQRSKQLWLSEGDMDNKFFYAAARKRQKTNQISSLLNDDGVSIGWDSGLKEVMVQYFTTLFEASETKWNMAIEGVKRKINQQQNNMLMAQVEVSEVKKVLFSMHPEKSPGLDGMSPGFY